VQSIGMTSMMDLFIRGRLAQTERTMKQAIERLSTGKRINRASDDPAGMIVADRLKVDTTKLEKSIEGAARHNHLLAAKEGALSVIADMAIELKSIVVQASNKGGLGQGELEALQVQADSILDGIDFVASTARYNGDLLLEGMSAASLGLRKMVQGEADPGSENKSEPQWFMNLMSGDLEAIDRAVESAGSSIHVLRGGTGLLMQRNDTQISLWTRELESLTSELSRIEDADYAQEVSKLVRSQVMLEVGQRSLVMHRESAGRVLNLLSA
jgi:flagellin